MNPPLPLDSSSTESDVFYVERSPEEGSTARNNTPAVLNSTLLSAAIARETITIASVALPEPQIVTIKSDSEELTIPYGFGNQHPIVPASLNDVNLTPYPFNVLATMAVIQPDEEYSPQSPEASNPSPISTPPLNLNTIEGWETPHRTTDEKIIYSVDEPRRVSWHISFSETFDSNEPILVSITSSSSSTPPPQRRQKTKLSMGMSFPKMGGVSQHTCEAFGQPLPSKKHPKPQGETQTIILLIRLLTNYLLAIFNLCAYILIGN